MSESCKGWWGSELHKLDDKENRSRVIRLSNSYSRVLDTHAVTHSYSGGGSLGGFSRSGGGGHSSFGGGGGFSGGGHSGVR